MVSFDFFLFFIGIACLVSDILLGERLWAGLVGADITGLVVIVCFYPNDEPTLYTDELRPCCFIRG
jgi:hypothetical protein